jgi:YebC/PmpR family DNA-binding regulatory protein
MSGHSKWSTIKHKKAATDKKRSKLWSKLARYVTMAARDGGGDPSANPRLRLAVDKAKAANMPNDTIDKAIRKGTGEGTAEAYEEITYEGYGPGGVAIMAQAVTDNRNRTSPEIKKLFERCGGNLGTPNSVAWMFSMKGVLGIAGSAVEEDRLMEIALENGAEDVSSPDPDFEVTCGPDEFAALKAAIEEAEIPIQSGDVAMVAANPVTPDLEDARKVLKLMDALDEHDDVTSVSTNCDLPPQLMAELSQN